MSTPPTVIDPRSARSRPAMRLSSVLLPEPDGPHQRQELPFRDRERDPLQDRDDLAPAAVGFADVAELDDDRCGAASITGLAGRRRARRPAGGPAGSTATRVPTGGPSRSSSRWPDPPPDGDGHVSLSRSPATTKTRSLPSLGHDGRGRHGREGGLLVGGGLAGEKGHLGAHLGQHGRAELAEGDLHGDRGLGAVGRGQDHVHAAGEAGVREGVQADLAGLARPAPGRCSTRTRPPAP